MRQVILFRDESGGWVVECPSLPGCVSQGDTRDEAIANIREAIDLYIEVLKEDGKPVPEDTYEAYLVAV
ncbi:MAG TPA: type II toxin-antitoxin system HicB family antitoxin [bacterium]